MAEIASDHGDLNEAERMLREALAINEETKDPSETAFALSSLGDVLVRAGRGDEASQILRKALTMYQELGEASDGMNVRLKIGAVQLDQDDAVAAQQEATAVLANTPKLEPEAAARAHALLAEALLAQGDAIGAARERDDALRIPRSNLERPTRFYLDAVRIKIDLHGKDYQSALSIAGALHEQSADLFAYELLAGLLEAEIQLATGDETARNRLTQIAARAQAHGFRSIERRAKQLANSSTGG